MNANVVLDRALEPRWLDLALDIALRDDPADSKRELLDLSLRDYLPATEGRRKTLKILMRVWVTPDRPVAQMVEWGRGRALALQDLRPLHLGAVMANYPFFGQGCAAVGRALALHQSVDVSQVRKALIAEWADREIVRVSSRALIRTLRAFGVLAGHPGNSSSMRGEKLAGPPWLHPWIAHALLLTRRLDEMDRDEVMAAAELFMFELNGLASSEYPSLERFSEGGSRIVLRQRMPANAPSDPGQGRLFRAPR
jgi:hypothetical protein